MNISGLLNKTVLITGGSGGLGRALARAFLRSESQVVITGRKADRLEDALQELRYDRDRVDGYSCDVTDRTQVEALAHRIQEKFGPVQILINNAGIARAVSFLDMRDDQWEEILRSNLTGTYNCCKVFLPAMVQARHGRIINIASTTAKVAYTHVSAYTTSKHGVLGLTRSLALETARFAITVNAICPGYLDNELTRENASRMAQRTGKTESETLSIFASSSPQKRLIAPEEVANLAVLIASEKLSGMTGQAINVDGGAVMA